MNNDNAPGQPVPPQLDPHALALWEELRAAIAAGQDWLVLQVDLQRFAAQVEATQRRNQPALTGAFRAVLSHFRDLVANWEEQRQLMKFTIQNLGWDFTTYVFQFGYENRIRFNDGTLRSMSARRLLCASGRFADLTLEGHLLKADGSEGKDAWWISLLRTPWSKIEEIPPATRRRK